MKVLVLNVHVPFVQGGAELLVNDLVRELRARGHLVELVQIPLIAVLKRFEDNMTVWEKIDLDHFGGDNVDKVIALKWPTYGAAHPKMNVWMLHQFRSVYDLWEKHAIYWKNGKELRALTKRFDKKHLKKANKIFTISKNVTKRLKHFNNIDSKVIYPPPSKIDGYQCNSYGDYLFFPSRIVDHKRQELVIKALPFTDKKTKVVFAGAPMQEQYLTSLKKMAEELGVEDRITWAGRISDQEKIDYYANCRAVLYPTLDEDYGYVTLEAMFSSKSVLTCTDSGGPLEFIRHNFSGLISEATPKSFAKIMNEITLNPDKAETFGKRAREVVEKIPFNWDHVLKKLLS